MAATREQLGEDRFVHAVETGRALSLDDLADESLAVAAEIEASEAANVSFDAGNC